ncbi:retinal-specific ATP-binding cassette transporter-like protein [Lates japonicus]|uniref:Retinal-specific ATP-binding cassette transporter-like protein n=1 Tax=Lates japonicus TaxID=270547 RepID=A0AAD3RA90_LATJO|nr:retinal-specific ATP-binding cassette transporter-like protein [Lates japonicus]
MEQEESNHRPLFSPTPRQRGGGGGRKHTVSNLTTITLPQANTTFEELERLRTMGKAWEEVAPQIWAFFQDGVQVKMIRDTIYNPSVMDFIDRSLEDAPFSSKHILNFLHNGPPEDRPDDMPDFDWQHIFNLTDRVIRMLNQDMEIYPVCNPDKFVALSTRMGHYRALDLEDSALGRPVFRICTLGLL